MTLCAACNSQRPLVVNNGTNMKTSCNYLAGKLVANRRFLVLSDSCNISHSFLCFIGNISSCFRWSQLSIFCLLLILETSQHWGGDPTLKTFTQNCLIQRVFIPHKKLFFNSTSVMILMIWVLIQVCLVVHGHGAEGLWLQDGPACGGSWR